MKIGTKMKMNIGRGMRIGREMKMKIGGEMKMNIGRGMMIGREMKMKRDEDEEREKR